MLRKTELKLTYPISLLLSTSKRKTCESISSIANLSGDSFCRILQQPIITMTDLVQIAKNIFTNRKLYLVIDDTIISKIYSQSIEGSCDNYNSSSGQTYRSLCSVAAVLTDGKNAIPIGQELWISKKFSPDNYQRKWEIAQNLITQIQPLLSMHMVVADGLYANVGMMKECLDKGILFEMRFHSNRVIEYHGQKISIKELDCLKLKKRRKARTKKGIWQGMTLFFTAVKKITKSDRVIITYQVSNYKAAAQVHVRNYSYRWCIEKFFRTAKQHLGLNDCQARSKVAQKNHIMNVFFAYALLQIEKIKKNLKNPEEALRRLKKKKFENLKSYFSRSTQIFEVVYA